MAEDATRPTSDDADTDTGEPAGAVTRSVELDADTEAVWRAVTDPGERALWLDDPDAAARRVRIDEASRGERLVWTWWHPGDEGDASTVTVELAPVVGGGTRVTVTEAVPAPVPVATATARAQAGIGAVGIVASGPARHAALRAPSWVRCGRDRWDARLLGLELLFVAARAGVA
jgi:uncharacterized protein YndB with AHSA1/START domain